MSNDQLKRELKKNLKILKLWRNEKMLDYNQCDKCKEIKIEVLCDFQTFSNEDELPICNECIKKMIENKEITKNGILAFTKKGMKIRIEETEKEIETLINYKNRYIKELKEINEMEK